MSVRGFTLLELLVTLAVLTLLISVGLPTLSHQIHNNRTKAAAMEFLGAVQLTRVSAVKTNGRATMRSRGGWQNGWEVFMDNNHDGIRDPNEEVIATHSLSGHLRIVGNQYVKDYISYLGTGASHFATGKYGGGWLGGTITVCPAGSGRGYWLILSRGGRVRLEKVDATVCDAL